MKIVYSILGAIGSIFLAIITFNSSTVLKQRSEIKKQRKKIKETELEREVLIDHAKSTRKKTIKSKEELDDEIKKLNNIAGPHFGSADELIEFVRSGGKRPN